MACLRATAALTALTALALLAGQGDAHAAPPDCCLRAPRQQQPFSKALERRLVSYRVQGPHAGCHLEAVVFITKKRRELCISPDEDWIPSLMRKMDEKNRKEARKRQNV